MEALLKALPRKIKIGAYDWKIKVQTGESEDYGIARFDLAEITLYPDVHQSPDRIVGTLLHELLHVIYHNEELAGVVGDIEESIVVGFETGLISVLRDNPKLFNWIKRGLKSTKDGRS